MACADVLFITVKMLEMLCPEKQARFVCPVRKFSPDDRDSNAWTHGLWTELILTHMLGLQRDVHVALVCRLLAGYFAGRNGGAEGIAKEHSPT